jgi:hypothetical protein
VFFVANLFILLSIIFALFNATFAKNNNIFITRLYLNRLISSLTTVCICVPLQLVDEINKYVYIPLLVVILIMLREITVAIEFTGIKLTGITIYINVLTDLVTTKTKSVISQSLKKQKTLNTQKR